MKRITLSIGSMALLAAFLGMAAPFVQAEAAGNAATPPPDAGVSGGDAARWSRVAAQLQVNGFAAAHVQECLALVQVAVQRGLPADPVLARIEEGAAKRVTPDALREALRLRMTNLVTAAAVLQDTGYGCRNSRHDALLRSVTLAVESGVEPATLRAVLGKAKGGQSERVRSIVEAGEAMRLSGMENGIVGPLMNDYIDRNLRRNETLRASRLAIQLHKAGMDGERIRSQLWSGTAGKGR